MAGEVRIEGGLGLEHGAGHANEAVGDGSEGTAMTVAAGAKGRVFRLASRVVLHSDAGPMVDSIAQADMGGLAHEHDPALAGSLGDGSHPRQTAKRLVVSPPQSLEGLGQQCGEDNPSDPGQGSEDRHITRLWPLSLGTLL